MAILSQSSLPLASAGETVDPALFEAVRRNLMARDSGPPSMTDALQLFRLHGKIFLL